MTKKVIFVCALLGGCARPEAPVARPTVPVSAPTDFGPTWQKTTPPKLSGIDREVFTLSLNYMRDNLSQENCERLDLALDVLQIAPAKERYEQLLDIVARRDGVTRSMISPESRRQCADNAKNHGYYSMIRLVDGKTFAQVMQMASDEATRLRSEK